MNPLKVLTSSFAIVGKECLVVLRRPSALATLILGPVLILAVFGISFAGQPPLRAVLVIPPNSGLSRDPAAYDIGSPGELQVVGTETDIEIARQDLRQRKADLIVSAPPDAASQLRDGKQITLRVEYDTVNPYQNAVVSRIADPLAARLNEKLVGAAIAEASKRSGASVQPNPQTLVAPTRVQAVDLAPTPPRLVSFYGVAVLALILQHLGLTLGALSTNGDRRQGMLTLLRVAPVSAFEMLLGKYVAFLVLCGAVTAVLVLIMHLVLGVPILGPLTSVAWMLFLLAVAAIGVGLVLSLLATSESQVIQMALLVLLASVFFGGLAIDLSQFASPLRAAAEFLPVTQATQLGQDLFLRGATTEPWRFVALGGMALVLTLLAWLLLHRELLLRG